MKLTIVANKGQFVITIVLCQFVLMDNPIGSRGSGSPVIYIGCPEYEWSGAPIWPFPWASVKPYPCMIFDGHHLYLVILSLGPHTGQVSVVQPAVSLSFQPWFRLIYKNEAGWCIPIPLKYVSAQLNVSDLEYDEMPE